MRAPVILSLLLLSVFAHGRWVLAQQAESQTELDYSGLAEPTFANRLSLTDEQRASIARILDERITALATAKPDERAQVRKDSNARLAVVLTGEQRESFKQIVSGGKLRFNFRQQKWPDVLDWFAGQAELSLIMDAAPQGLFTYSDSKEYTPAEAIDLLNSVLLSKGYTLMRREKMLLVVDTTEGIPFELAEKVSVEELASRGRFEIVTVEFPLEGRPVETCVAAVQELIGKYGRVTPLTTAGKLLVTETAGKLAAINIVIASIPVPKPPPKPPVAAKPPSPVFAVYPAKGLDPVATVETLQGLFSAATIRADPTAEEIHAYASPALQDGIKASIEKMVANVSGDNATRLEIYPVRADDLSRLQEQLTLAVPDAQISADDAQSRLLVVANTEDQAKVAETLKQLGVTNAPTVGDATVVVYPVASDATEQLVALLQQVLPRALIVSQPGRIAVRGRPDEQVLAKTTLDQFSKADQDDERRTLQFYALSNPLDSSLLAVMQETASDAVITLLDDGMRLSVFAPAGDHELIGATLKQIDSREPASKRTLQLYPVTAEQKAKFEIIVGDLESELGNIRIILDASPREVAAWASEEQHAKLAQVLQGLSHGDTSLLSLHRFPVSVASPDQLLLLLNDRFPGTQFLMNDRNDLLLVWANEDRLDAVRSELEKLTEILPQREVSSLATYSADGLTTDELQSLLTPVAPDARMTPDVPRNRVVVWASDMEHQAISAALEKLDSKTPVADQRVLEMYPVPESDAASILSAVQTLLPSSQSSLDSTSQNLIVIASAKEQERVDSLVKKLAPVAASNSKVLISYALDQASPVAVVEMLRELRPDISFAADSRSNRVLVTAPLREQARLQAVIEQLDASPSAVQEKSVKSYQLRILNPTTVIELLAHLVPDVELTGDDDARRLLASGSKLELQKLDEILRRIEEEDSHSGEVHSYEIGAADPDQVRNVLVQLVPTAVISTNPEARRVMVWASATDHLAILQAVQQLTQQSMNEARKLQTYPLPSDFADTARTVMESVAPGASITLDTSEEQLIVWGTADDQQLVKQALDELLRNQPKLDGVALRVHQASPDVLQSAEPLLTDVAPRARLVTGDDPNRWLVWAQPEEHEAIDNLLATLAEQLSTGQPLRSIEAYAIPDLEAGLAREVILGQVANATILDNSDDRRLLVQAMPDEHEKIGKLMEQLKQLAVRPDTYVHVYPVQRDRIVAQSVLDALDPIAKGDASIQVNSETNSIIARASEADHARLKAAIGALTSQLPPFPGRETRVYTLELASPESVQQAVEPMIPNASVVADPASGTLLVTATEPDLEKISEVIDKLDTASGQQPTLKAYPIRQADPNSVYQSVIRAFENSSDFSVTYQPAARTLFVVATPKNHLVFAELVKSLDQPGPPRTPRIPSVYTLANVQGEAAASAIVTLFRDQVPAIDVQFDSLGNALVVVATKEQHLAIEEALKKMEGGERQLEVFELQDTDPFVVEEAVYQLFLDVPEGAAPAVSSDYGTQKLFVRGTQAQIQQIRNLLIRLGEPIAGAAEERQTGDVRTIPFRGDAFEAAKQVELVWPRLRPNRIQVITPSRPNLLPVQPGKRIERSEPPTDPKPGDLPTDDKETSAGRTSAFQFATLQQSTRKNAPDTGEAAQPKPAVTENQPDKPTIVLVPEEGRITIASPDHEALDQLESLLRAMARSSGASGANPNFAVYLLKNTGAAEMEQLLSRLFDELPITRSSMGDVVIVADERLNALVVHGSRKDREVVEELLQVLDTDDMPDPLVVQRPELVTLQHAQASRVLAILETVYQTQLTTGGGRKQVQIPKGVSSEVASVLQQINAAASGPVLTLDVDEATNSIVLRAPPELSEEIKSFAKRLDDQSIVNPNRHVRVIRLRKSKADRMQSVLEQFLLESKK